MSDQLNKLHAKVGLDPISDEDHENITSTFAALTEENDNNDTSVMDASPSDPTAGISVDSVFWVNVTPNSSSLSQDMNAKLTAITNDVNLNSSFFNSRAKQMVAQKIASRELDANNQTKVANYFTKVVNFMVERTPWLSTSAVMTKQKHFNVGSDQFHQALVAEFTQGLNVPNNIVNNVEALLGNCQNVIKNGASKGEDTPLIFIYITVFNKMDPFEVWQPGVRTILLKPSRRLVQYTVEKGANKQNVDVDIEYVQYDGSFNENMFRNGGKDQIQAMQQNYIQDFVKGITNVPMGP